MIINWVPGDLAQVYNDSGDLGGFGELEIHAEAIDFVADKRQCQLKSKTTVGFFKLITGD
ncbi:MAG: hypothetical protein MK193_12935 [Lentisphaeria bacterium]|nr:hypothetical protein [Lentisphaeria bacterium]